MSDLSPDAKNLWERAKGQGLGPTDEQVERVQRSVLERIAAAPAAPPAAPLAKWAKIVAVCAALGGVAFVGAKLVGRSTRAPAPPPPESVTSVAAPAEAPTAVEPSPAAAAAPAEAQGKAKTESTHATPSAKASSASPDTLPEQVRIISDAKVALGHRAYAQALAKANEYASRYPKGVFAEEQLALRIQALCGLGRDKDTARSIETLERTFPGSRQLEKVRSACASATPSTP